ncbi:DUF3826 domain-containing protein [Oleiharenicola lentus]|uniref:DUF3826 domain-containing protein n=1 Tax=Oleiharenicola lentus TaxID=2508720 RepID=UPI003F664913
MKSPFVTTLLALTLTFTISAHAQTATGETHPQLAERIIKRLRFAEPDKTDRIITATVEYLDALKIVLDARQVVIDQLAKESPTGKPDDTKVAAAYVKTKAEYLPLRRAYVGKLEADLVPFLIDRVKDGLTQDGLPRFWQMYQEMVPKLKPEEKAHIYGLLVEGRENVMVAISAKAQKQWWDKYRGITNNYIATQGHDFPTLSRAWDAANGVK